MARWRSDERADRRAAGWALLDLTWERVLRFFGFAELPYGWVARATRRDLPLAFGVLRMVTKRAPWLLGPLGVTGVVGVVLLATLPPTHGQLRHDIDHARLPAGREAVTIRQGNVLCLGGCSSLTRVVVVAGGVEEWTTEVDRRLREIGGQGAGWTTGVAGGRTLRAAGYRRRFVATVSAAPVAVAVGGRAQTLAVPDGHVGIRLRVEATRDRTPSA